MSDTTAPVAVAPATEPHFICLSDVEKADDYVFEIVPVPEWGGPGACVRVGTISGQDRGTYDALMQGKRQAQRKGKGKGGVVELPVDFRERIVVLTCHDQDRKRIFPDTALTMLSKKSSAVLDRIFTVACRLNGLTADEVEEMEKNSESPQSDESGSN